MLLIVAGGVALAVGLVLLVVRNEEELTATWAHLLAPSGERLRRSLEAQIKAEEGLEALRRTRQDEAVRSGQILKAAGVAAEDDAPALERRRALRLIRRMLRARGDPPARGDSP